MPLLVGGALVLLAAVNAAEITAAYRAAPAAAAASHPPPPPSESPTQAAHPIEPAIALVNTILGRPLFEPNRRPIGGPAVAAQGATGLPRIAGIVVGPADRLVIFAAENGGKPTTVAQGSKLNGYLIRSVQDNAVTVVGPNGEQTLHPSFDPSARVAAAPPRSPNQPGFPQPGFQRPGFPPNPDGQNLRPRPPGFIPASEAPNPNNED